MSEKESANAEITEDEEDVDEDEKFFLETIRRNEEAHKCGH
jgi:hypothetical protein